MRYALWRVVAAATVGSAAALAGGAVTAGAQTANATVTVVHGLRGVVADVYVDGKVALPAFQPDRVTDPISVPAGTHHIEVRPTGQPATSPPAAAVDVTLAPGSRDSIVAHLDAAGHPAITMYQDDVSPVPAGQSRAEIRHDAAAPAIDVSLNQTVVARTLANPNSVTASVAPATYQVSVVTAGTGKPLAPAQSATLSEGTATAMYLIGSAQAGTLSWVAEQFTGLATPPNKIQTGDSGLAATGGGHSRVPVVVGAALAGAFLGAGVMVLGRRRTLRA
jgi:hypothetical protein